MVRARLVLGKRHGMFKSGADEIIGGPDLSVHQGLLCKSRIRLQRAEQGPMDRCYREADIRFDLKKTFPTITVV